MTDGELLERWAAGDGASGEALFERHFEAVARFFRNKTGGVAGQGITYDDLVQQTFLGCVEARERFRRDASFRTFLFAVARNVLSKHYRSRTVGAFDPATTSVVDLGASPSAVVARDRDQQLLLQGLRTLPVDAQIALELHFWEGMTAAEIAGVIGVPVGTAKTRLRRARQLLEAAVRGLQEGDRPVDPTGTRLETWAREVRGTLFRDPQ